MSSDFAVGFQKWDGLQFRESPGSAIFLIPVPIFDRNSLAQRTQRFGTTQLMRFPGKGIVVSSDASENPKNVNLMPSIKPALSFRCEREGAGVVFSVSSTVC
jgi:hypothetical protein